MRRRTHERDGDRRGALVDRGDALHGSSICSIDEAIARYPGQWVVMRVTGYDEHHRPARGEVIIHSCSCAKAGRVFTERLVRQQANEGRYYLFDGHPRVTSGEELRRSLAKLRDEGDPLGRWPGLR